LDKCKHHKKIKKNTIEGFDKKKNKFWKNIGKQNKPSKRKHYGFIAKLHLTLNLYNKPKHPTTCKVDCGIKVKQIHLEHHFENLKPNPSRFTILSLFKVETTTSLLCTNPLCT